jgi:cytochrome b
VSARLASSDGVADEGLVAARSPSARRIRVWDLPLRVFHWSLAVAVGGSVLTGELGGNWMDLHGRCGLVVVGLLVFRVVWGLAGPTHARFASFAPTRRSVRAYLAGRWQGVGHNPLGALSVFALLALLAAQAGTGLFSNDDVAFTGPLYGTVGTALADRLTGIHRLSVDVLLGLVALHLAAVVYYVRVRRDPIIRPMLTGWKEVAHGESTSRSRPAVLVLAVLLALAVTYRVSGAGSAEAHGPAPTPAPTTVNRPAW